jgi:aminodeoxyfutalosine deaminase
MPRIVSGVERAFIEQMPKAELHVHLEGSVYPETMLDLARKHDVRLPIGDVDAARQWFQFRDFPHFVEIYLSICSVLLDEEDYARISFEQAVRARQENILYQEVTFAPASFIDPRSSALPDVVLAGLREGRRRAQEELGVTLEFILDPVRTRSEEEVMLLARWCAENLGDGLVGFGLGGIELGNPPDRFADAFAYVSDAGARLSLHAGETDGPHSVWAALSVGSERIGHGVTSVLDSDLVQHLADEQVVLEVSPTSNICLGVAPSYADHPMRTLHEAGVPVTVNSDDPPMFSTTLTNEYLVLAEQFDFTLDELEALTLQAVEATFQPVAERNQMVATFQQQLKRLRRQIESDGQPLQ